MVHTKDTASRQPYSIKNLIAGAVMIGAISLGVVLLSQSSAISARATECTLANQELQRANLNANPPNAHIVTTADGKVIQDYYSRGVPDPAIAKYQATDGQARVDAAHCADPLISIVVWTGVFTDWNKVPVA
jgi:hypothetical protein